PPRDTRKASYQVNKETPADPQEWLRTAHIEQGSWWPDALAWLGDRCGADKGGPRDLGGGGVGAAMDAPRTNVFDSGRDGIMYEGIGRSLGTDYFHIATQLTREERGYLRRTRDFV